MEYLSVKETAKKWGVSLRHVQKLCSDGRIDGALRFGDSKVWMIPKSAIKPVNGKKITKEKNENMGGDCND